MQALVVTASLVAAALTAAASPISADFTLATAGNGQGWNDGAYYTGFVSLMSNGQSYTGLCLDALHDSYIGETWEALYIPLLDPSLDSVLAAYFPGVAPDGYAGILEADVIGYLLTEGADESTSTYYQHEVWGQFDPGGYDGTALAALAAQVMNGETLYNAQGVAVTVSSSNFGLLVDANWASGGTLTQAFLIDPPRQTPEPGSLLLAGAALVVLGATRYRRP